MNLHISLLLLLEAQSCILCETRILIMGQRQLTQDFLTFHV